MLEASLFSFLFARQPGKKKKKTLLLQHRQYKTTTIPMASFSEWFAAQSAVRASVGSPTGAMAAPAPPASSSLSSFFSSASVNPDPEIPTAVVADPPPSLNMNSVISLLPAIMRVGPLAAALGGGAAPTSDVPEWTCGMNAGQRFQAFGILLVTSLVLYIVSIFVFLPMVIFMPSK